MKLKLEDLAVESFVTDGGSGRGTVRAQSILTMDFQCSAVAECGGGQTEVGGGWSCQYSCNPDQHPECDGKTHYTCVEYVTCAISCQYCRTPDLPCA
jgi:hypothetical protein